MAQQRRLRALRNDRNLARFVVEGRTTGRKLGTGSYGSVEEVRNIRAALNRMSTRLPTCHMHPFLQVEVKGLVCAGKQIHEALLDAGNVGVEDLAQKYLQECQLMSDLRHPTSPSFWVCVFSQIANSLC